MDTNAIQKTVEQLAEGLVLADASDLRALAEVHSGLQETARWAGDQGLERAAAAANAAAAMVEQVILSEAPDPAEALRVVGETAGVFQSFLRRNEAPGDDVWPRELGLDPAVEEAAPAMNDAAPGADAPAGGAGRPAILEGDTDLLRDFVSEATEHLDNADVHLLTLESDPEDTEAMNAVFRAFHTIKGVAGFLGLEEIQALSHEAENLLDKARRHELQLVDAAKDITFDAVDMLNKLVRHVDEALTSGGSLETEDGLAELAETIRRITAGEEDVGQIAAELPPCAPDQKLGEILEANGTASPEAVRRALDYQRERLPTQTFGKVVVQMGKATPEQVAAALTAQREDPSLGKIGKILVDAGAMEDTDVEAALGEQAKTRSGPKLGEVLVQGGDAEARDVARALRSQRMQQQGAAHTREPVKVDANRLDQLIDAIGELVIAEAMVSQSAAQESNGAGELAGYLAQLDKITRELQEMGMSLRMVPIRTTFQKMARLVRDLAKKAGKKAEFITEGDDTELDKSVIDKIGDPLVHMVRNAVDHGLEPSAEDRTRAGKAPAGRITLRAFHKGGSIYVEVEDDGRGLNSDAILAKARDRGLVAEGDVLSERQILNLVFLPGFSTAQQITDVSGRGVGMDVVKKNIEALRGEVDISSTPGHGTKFTIRLPLTMAIIDGMVVRVGQQRYIIPTLSIVTSLRPTRDQIVSVVERGEVIRMQGNLLPVHRLERILEVPGAIHDLAEGIVVVVEADGQQTGLLVDDLLGQQQIVIKSLGETLQGTPGLAGGAIMPDGRVGLILDIAGLVKLATEHAAFDGRNGGGADHPAGGSITSAQT